jgi:hypothetical protein
MAKEKPARLNVKFKGVGKGEKLVRVGVRVKRDGLAFDVVDELLIGAQIDCVLTVDPNAAKGEPEGQQKIDKVAEPDGKNIVQVAVVGEVRSVSTTPEAYNFSLTVPRDGVKDDVFALAWREGTLVATRIGNAGKDEDGNG